MIDNNRFKNIRSLQDIKLEKAKLKYDMLVAEKKLTDNVSVFENIFNVSTYFSQISKELSGYIKVFSSITSFFRKRKSSKRKSDDS